MSNLEWLYMSLLVSIVSILMPATASADLEKTMPEFRSCVNPLFAIEREKKSPNIDTLIANCKAEFDAVIADIPLGARDQLRREIRRQMKEKLE